MAQAVEWVAARRPELVVVTGDLLSNEAEPLSSNGFSESWPCFVVLGNHDYADSRDPFSQHVDPAVFAALEGVTLLGDEEIDVELRGQRVQIVGVAPRTYAARRAEPHLLADRDSALRLLLCHFPGIARRIPEGSFHLILAGHYHAGQIVVPYPGGTLNLAHPRTRDVRGLYRYGASVLHVSPGLGHDIRPLPVLRPAGGHGAGCTIARAMTSRLAGLTGATLETTPSVCQSCVWWQSRGNREPEKRKWVERAETEWGAWGTVYRDDDGRVLGSMQYGPAQLFPAPRICLRGRPRTTPCSSPARTSFRTPNPGSSSPSSSPRSARPGTRAHPRSRRSPTGIARGRPPPSGSSCTARCSRATSWPTLAFGRFARRGGSS